MPNDDPKTTADQAGHACSTAELCPLPEPVAWFRAPYGTLEPNPLFRVTGPQTLEWALACYTEDQLRAAVRAERERFVRIIEAYQVPVGNSAAGEMAAEWTMEALREIRDAIRGPDADEQRTNLERRHGSA